MRNILIAIGCNKYASLPALTGAEQDAQRIFSLLTGECGDYIPDESQLLLSPTLAIVQTALRAVFKMDQELDVLTVFFAGHGSVRAGNFYLCVADTSPDGMSISGISMLSLFSIINEFRPRQVNLIVDACEAGGSSFDVGNLLKPELVGAASSPSVAFLGACAADQSARESASGGVLTNALVSYLIGEREIQTRQPFLDLIEVGAEVSRELRLKGIGQTPVAWGLTLYGDGHFARNPHFDKHPAVRHFPLPTLAANSDVARRIQAHAADLWEEHRVIKEEVMPARLLALIRNISRDDSSGDTTLQLVSGLAKTLPIRAEEADDLLGRSICLSTCAVALLPFLDALDARSRARELLLERSSLNRGCRKELIARLDDDGDTLLNPSGVAGDLFYLPLRVTKLLGWIGADFLIDRILDLCTPEAEYFQLIERIVATYPNSLVAVSDEQAPFLYLFFKACEACGRNELAQEVLLSIYASFAERGGKITRVSVDGTTAYKYLVGLTSSNLNERPLAPANPSYICPILLLFGNKFGLGANWRLKDLDRLSIAYFFPNTFRDFALGTISRGTNHTFRIGFGIWTLSDFQREFERTLTSLKIPDGDEETALSILSAILLPDRTPLLLEDARINTRIRRKHVSRDRSVA